MNIHWRGLSPLWRIILFVSVGLLPVVGMYVSPGVHSSSPSGQNDIPTKARPVKITNLTQSLLVTDVQRHGQEVRLSLHNNSQKDIVAFKISAGSYGITLDFTPDVFKAGTVHVKSLTIPKSNNAEDEVSIVAIIFDDETGEGNPSAVKRMMERRRGAKLQLLRILPLINALIASEGPFSERLDAAEKAAVDLPDFLSASDSPEFRSGLHDAKQLFLSDLRTANTLQNNPNRLLMGQQLRYFQSRYADKISKLPN